MQVLIEDMNAYTCTYFGSCASTGDLFSTYSKMAVSVVVAVQVCYIRFNYKHLYYYVASLTILSRHLFQSIIKNFFKLLEFGKIKHNYNNNYILLMHIRIFCTLT